jgi:cytosine/adenosine deaminase-related metal-dependent hydrolase
MVLNNVRLVNNDNVINVRISGDKIISVSKAGIPHTIDPIQLTFEKAIVFPGLINSHDHLDFNLFPQLGNKIYKNYAEWGGYIHKNYKSEIDAILKIPVSLRAQWGMYKNLLCGITTVVNHGEILEIKDPLITVFQKCYSLHSTGFEKRWKLKLNNPFNKKYPYVIHTGEGTDEFSASEISELIKWNIFKKGLIAIHGVAMKKEQAKNFKALVWCPASNYFLLDKTASIDQLKQETKIVFGTDSTLTAGWNLWDQLRLARDTKMVTDSELFDMLTASPVNVWGLPQSGKIAADYQADIVVARTKNVKAAFEDFYALNPEDILLVMHQGQIRLFDEDLYIQFNKSNYIQDSFYKIYINGNCKYIRGNLTRLIKDITKYSQSVSFPVNY